MTPRFTSVVVPIRRPGDLTCGFLQQWLSAIDRCSDDVECLIVADNQLAQPLHGLIASFPPHATPNVQLVLVPDGSSRALKIWSGLERCLGDTAVVVPPRPRVQPYMTSIASLSVADHQASFVERRWPAAWRGLYTLPHCFVLPRQAIETISHTPCPTDALCALGAPSLRLALHRLKTDHRDGVSVLRNGLGYLWCRYRRLERQLLPHAAWLLPLLWATDRALDGWETWGLRSMTLPWVVLQTLLRGAMAALAYAAITATARLSRPHALSRHAVGPTVHYIHTKRRLRQLNIEGKQHMALPHAPNARATEASSYDS